MGSQAVRRAGAGWPGWRTAGAAFALLAAVAAVPLVAPAAQAQEGAALADPPENVPRTPAMEQACSAGAGPCQQAVVHAIDVARAAEGVGPLELPSYYDSLSVAEQLLVLTDLERVDRGLTGFTGLSSRLDALSKDGRQFQSGPYGAGRHHLGIQLGRGRGLGAAGGLRLDVRRRPAFAQYGLHQRRRQRLLGPPPECPQQLRASSRHRCGRHHGRRRHFDDRAAYIGTCGPTRLRHARRWPLSSSRLHRWSSARPPASPTARFSPSGAARARSRPARPFLATRAGGR